MARVHRHTIGGAGTRAISWATAVHRLNHPYTPPPSKALSQSRRRWIFSRTAHIEKSHPEQGLARTEPRGFEEVQRLSLAPLVASSDEEVVGAAPHRRGRAPRCRAPRAARPSDARRSMHNARNDRRQRLARKAAQATLGTDARQLTLDELQARAEAAYQERVQRISNAWRTR